MKYFLMGLQGKVEMNWLKEGFLTKMREVT